MTLWCLELRSRPSISTMSAVYYDYRSREPAHPAPVYKDSFDNVLGILHLRRVARLILNEDFCKADLLQLRASLTTSRGNPMHTQLYNFQKEKQRLAMVVDEYGDIQGIVTLEDIWKKSSASLPATLPPTCLRFCRKKTAAM